MNCANCQSRVEEGAKFCDHCGAPILKANPYEPAYPSASTTESHQAFNEAKPSEAGEMRPELKPMKPESIAHYAVQDSELWAVMFALAGENPTQELVPMFKPEIGVMYKVGDIEVPAERLKRLEKQEGILDALGQVSFAACPKCQSLNLAILLKCPNCGKQTLSKSEMLIHYECGHLTPLHEVVQPGKTVYTCPKCGKLMKRVGIDYGRPGLAFTCPECKEVSQYPLVKLLCHNGHELKLDESELTQFSVYKLGKGLSTIPRIITMLNEIKGKLTSRGHECMILANVTGESGNKYVTPLLVLTIPPLIADFILDRSTWEFQAIEAIRKTADLNARSLLVVQKELTQQVENMINPKKIQVVPFDQEEEIVRKVTEAIDDALTFRPRMKEIGFSLKHNP